jgi:hypothetical protein
VIDIDIINGLRTAQEKLRTITSENYRYQTRIRELEHELRHQNTLFDNAVQENYMFRRSSGHDSGFGSVGDSDEALERQKASQAKERMSSPYEILLI